MNKSINKSASIRKKENLARDILALLRKSDLPLSTSDLMNGLNRAWHTIDRACLMLQIEGKIDGFKIGKMNLWRLKK